MNAKFLFNLFTILMARIDSTSNFTLSAFMSVHVPQSIVLNTMIEQIVELDSARVIQMRKDLIGAGDGVVDFLQLIPSRSPVISCLLSSSVLSLQTGLRFCTHIVSLCHCSHATHLIRPANSLPFWSSTPTGPDSCLPRCLVCIPNSYPTTILSSVYKARVPLSDMHRFR